MQKYSRYVRVQASVENTWALTQREIARVDAVR